MIRNFSDLEDLIAGQGARRVALAMAEEPDSLKAVLHARKRGIADPVLIGNRKALESIARRDSLDINGCRLVETDGEAACAEKAVDLVRNGEADCLMKGKTGTAAFLRAALNREKGIRKGNLLSHITFMEWRAAGKMLLLTDCAIAINPDLDTKIEIINNAVLIARDMGIEKPKVAIVGALEKVNAQLPGTMEAAILSQMARRGQIKNCIIDGPLAFDNALLKHSCEIKGIETEVGGDPDIILLPDLEAANILYKALTIFSDVPLAGIITGAAAPMILVSRADNDSIKYRSILTAVALSK